MLIVLPGKYDTKIFKVQIRKHKTDMLHVRIGMRYEYATILIN